MSTQAAAQHEQAADQYGHAARPSMDEERIQMVVDYYKSTLLLDSGVLGSNVVREARLIFKTIEK